MIQSQFQWPYWDSKVEVWVASMVGAIVERNSHYVLCIAGRWSSPKHNVHQLAPSEVILVETCHAGVDGININAGSVLLSK